jgi:hypothetical protein
VGFELGRALGLDEGRAVGCEEGLKRMKQINKRKQQKLKIYKTERIGLENKLLGQVEK